MVACNREVIVELRRGTASTVVEKAMRVFSTVSLPVFQVNTGITAPLRTSSTKPGLQFEQVLLRPTSTLYCPRKVSVLAAAGTGKTGTGSPRPYP